MDLMKLLQDLTDNLQFVLVCILVTALVILIARAAEKYWLKENVTPVGKTRYITICAMLGAISAVLMIFEFPLPFLAPSFYELDFSEVPVMIGAFFLGPVGGVIIELVKVLLKLVIKGTSTAFVGDLGNFVIGCSMVVPAAVIYHFHKTRRSAILGLVVGTLVMTVFGSTFNAFYLIPAFSTLFFGGNLDAIIDMGSAVNPAINSVGTLVLMAVVPLNLIKGTLVSAVTVVLYKHISRLLHGAVTQQA